MKWANKTNNKSIDFFKCTQLKTLNNIFVIFDFYMAHVHDVKKSFVDSDFLMRQYNARRLIKFL